MHYLTILLKRCVLPLTFLCSRNAFPASRRRCRSLFVLTRCWFGRCLRVSFTA
jgi:hypothetical protein